eukprot:731700-Alexandrium_andersonii.AAC.1
MESPWGQGHASGARAKAQGAGAIEVSFTSPHLRQAESDDPSDRRPHYRYCIPDLRVPRSPSEQ